MRRFLPFLLVLALLLPAQSAAAAPAQPHLLVVFIGGLGTSSAHPGNFGQLQSALMHPGPGGFARADFRYFAYGGSFDAYTPEASCQPLAQSEQQLADLLRWTRDTHQADGVILVGHSNGGVIALDVPAVAPDLLNFVQGGPFIRRIVTIDSPLMGLTDWRATLAELDFAATLGTDGCAAAVDLAARNSNPAWQPYVAQLASWEMASGVQLAVVANPNDSYVPFGEQQVDAPVNYVMGLDDGGNNHASLLTRSPGVAYLAGLVPVR